MTIYIFLYWVKKQNKIITKKINDENDENDEKQKHNSPMAKTIFNTKNPVLIKLQWINNIFITYALHKTCFNQSTFRSNSRKRRGYNQKGTNCVIFRNLFDSFTPARKLENLMK